MRNKWNIIFLQVSKKKRDHKRDKVMKTISFLNTVFATHEVMHFFSEIKTNHKKEIKMWIKTQYIFFITNWRRNGFAFKKINLLLRFAISFLFCFRSLLELRTFCNNSENLMFATHNLVDTENSNGFQHNLLTAIFNC